MIALFSDFGLEGPYTGQMKAVLASLAPAVPVIDLISDAPVHDPKSASYLLAAYSTGFPAGTIFLSVVDPGVGGPRRGLVVRMADCWFVGPDNGLVEHMIRQRAEDETGVWEILWKPEICSASFHGRDIFSPVAARLAAGEILNRGNDEEGFQSVDTDHIRYPAWPDDLAEIIYFDHFGNAMTGIRTNGLRNGQSLQVAGQTLPFGETFTSVECGDMFCYGNANGLMEVAVNRGSARNWPGVELGSKVLIVQQ